MIYNSEHALHDVDKNKPLLFLAGSIDLELPGNWRKTVVDKLTPRFNFFDPTSLNHASLNKSEWEEHIKWELLAMEMSKVIILNFLPKAKSPISLIELGLNTMGKKLIVVCPDEFYKSQYIQVLCARYSTPIFTELNKAVEFIKTNILEFNAQ